jgi:NAD(P)-dependent dehydrogenase (short-subunit alcohol dehydrogenase family)
MADALRLYGLNAVIMAGASGIGEAVCRTFVKHGAAVLALDTEASGVESVYKSVRAVTARTVAADSDDLGSAAVAVAKKELGGIDILVNYVELPQSRPVADKDETQRDELLRTRAAMYESLTGAALPLLRNSPAGRIINIGFVRSVFAIDGEAAYEKCHDALLDFTRTLAAENGSLGVFSNVVQPGAIMTRESRPVYSEHIDLRDYCIKRSAARRIGETVDVAKAVLFLASDDSAFVNGTAVMVDGGPATGD